MIGIGRKTKINSNFVRFSDMFHTCVRKSTRLQWEGIRRLKVHCNTKCMGILTLEGMTIFTLNRALALTPLQTPLVEESSVHHS